MKPQKKITDPNVLRPSCDSEQFKFETTAELEELKEFIGQARALDAVQFGIRINQSGYNLYALGPSGIGKHSVIRKILDDEAKTKTPPADWCYIYNFKNPQKPIALKLPTGLGSALQRDMELLIEDLSASIPAIFGSEGYRSQMQKITDEFSAKQEKMFKNLEEEAKQHDLTILTTSGGFVVAPTKNGKVISDKDFNKLSDKEKKEKEKIITELTEKLTNVIQQIPQLHQERHKKEKEVQNEFTMSAVAYLIDKLKKKYTELPQVLNYLTAVKHDVVANVKDFLKREETGVILPSSENKPSLTRYQVNVIVDNVDTEGTPVIYEDNPSYTNLIGRIEYISQLGTLITNFTLIRSGALHRANGGYLMLDALKLLTQPFAWDMLKRVLYAGKITIELPSQMVGLMSTLLEPDPIPLDIKIVLMGDRLLYYLLCDADSDFNELFKVAADFEEQIQRNPENLQLYAKLIATLAHKKGLKPFHRTAVARIIEQSARMMEDAEKLSIHIRSVNDLMREADYWAKIANHQIVLVEDVQQAIDKKIYRLDRVRENLYEEIQRDLILIDTTGKKIGQINGISVIQIGDFIFANPIKITAIARLGKGEVIDIEREVELGGPIHSKGVFILAGFLQGRYAKDSPLSLSASLVFEQSYNQIEGDSASVAELCVLISALAAIPINQSLAVTGSVNQHGQIQPIGGINEKIEGFFDVCNSRGLTGEQGVVIPKANLQNLMLREDVVAAIVASQFYIYPMETIDEALTILTGIPAGERKKDGQFPKNCVNYRVEKTLLEFAEKSKEEEKIVQVKIKKRRPIKKKKATD